MAYSYEIQRTNIFTESGQRMFLAIRDNTKNLLRQAGAVRSQEMMRGAGSGDSWDMLACVDRLVELGEVREITAKGAVAGQHRVFVAIEN